jgi:hypothetical protein
MNQKESGEVREHGEIGKKGNKWYQNEPERKEGEYVITIT